MDNPNHRSAGGGLYPASDFPPTPSSTSLSISPYPIQFYPYQPILDLPHNVTLSKIQILKSFADLFLECDSWGYSVGALAESPEKPGGVDWCSTPANWKLSRSKLLNEWYDSHQVIGKRFGNWTNYFVLDIDRPSVYHPLQGSSEALSGIRKVLAAMGLPQSLILTSSHSRGLHLYFPLPRPVKSDRNAQRIRDRLHQAGYPLKDGHLELFPNVRTDQTVQFKAHRLPLQTGSFHWYQGRWQRDVGDFVEAWHAAAAHQDIEHFMGRTTASAPTTGPNQTTSRKRFNLAERMQWTGPGQSNENLGAIVAYCIEVEGLRDPDELAARGWELVYAAGYETYASAAEKKDKAHLRRWIKCKLKKLGGWTGNKAGNTKPNQHRSNDSDQRLLSIIENLGNTSFVSINQFCNYVNHESKQKFGVGFGKNTILKKKEMWIHLIQINQDLLKPVHKLINGNEAYQPIQQGV
jgi:hypothetical protein